MLTLTHPAHSWVNFTGGRFEGTFGNGEIMSVPSPPSPTSRPPLIPLDRRPGGQDAQHLTPASHPTSPLSAQLSTRYLLRTDSGKYIQVQTRGWRTGPPEVMQRLSDAAKEGFEGVCPGPDEYKFRLFIEMETDANDLELGWLNTAMWVGSGVRSGRQGEWSSER